MNNAEDIIKSISYAEGYLTAIAAVLQDNEWTDGKPGNITLTCAEVRKVLRNAQTRIACDQNEIRDLRNENETLNAEVPRLRNLIGAGTMNGETPKED